MFFVAKDFKKAQFYMFKPLFEGLRKQSKMSMMIDFWEIIRRLILLYVAMFMQWGSLFQIHFFMMLTFLSLLYLVHAKPYKLKINNFLQVFNEIMILFLSYLLINVNGVVDDIDRLKYIGIIMMNTLYFTWAVNIVILLVSLGLFTYRMIKRCNNQRIRRMR